MQCDTKYHEQCSGIGIVVWKEMKVETLAKYGNKHNTFRTVNLLGKSEVKQHQTRILGGHSPLSVCAYYYVVAVSTGEYHTFKLDWEFFLPFDFQAYLAHLDTSSGKP